jgi:hypothetical protein
MSPAEANPLATRISPKFILQPIARHCPRAMPSNGARSVLKIMNGSFFERGITGMTNYEFRRRLHKLLMMGLLRHARSRLGAAFAPAGGATGRRGKAVEEGRRGKRAAEAFGRAQRGDRARRRLDGETPGAARQQRRRLLCLNVRPK